MRSALTPPAATVASLLLLLSACGDSPTEPGEPAPVAAVEFDPDFLRIYEGETVPLTGHVILRSDEGEVLEGREIEWTSADPSVATVSPAGELEGVSAGETEIEARSEGVSGFLAVEVEEAPEVEITSVTPDTIREGDTVVIEGGVFLPQDVAVFIAGLEARILSVNENRIEVRAPTVCRPAGEVEVAVRILGGRVGAAVDHPGTPGDPLGMEVGEFRLIQDPAAFCLHFQATADDEEYVVGLQSTSAAVSSLTPARFTAVTEGLVADRAPAPDALAASSRDGSGSRTRSVGRLPEVTDERHRAWERHAEAERRLRARDLELGRELLRLRQAEPVAAFDAQAAAEVAAQQGSVPGDVSEGDEITIRVPDLDGDNLCQDFVEITTEVVRMGDRGVWLEDVENPSPGFSASDYNRLSGTFDDDVYPAVVDHFGEPTDFDGNDRIVIVLSQVVNEFEDRILGFVTSADFFRRAEDNCPSSDFGEYFYTRAPVETENQTIEEARDDFFRLVAHELTHVIQFGRRIDDGRSQFQTVWELEGQAVLGEEVAGHRVTGRSARQNLGFQVALGRDDGTGWYLRPFNDLFRYWGLAGRQDEWRKVDGAPEECSWLARNVRDDHGAPCEMGQREPYGVAWSFLRWITDHEFPDDEGTFHRSLIDTNDRGFSSIERLTNESREVLLAEWAATLYADGRVPDSGDARISFPSWDLLDIDESLAADGPPDEARLLPQERGFSAFSDGFQVRAASSAYYLMGGAGRPATFLRATGEGDAGLPAHMQLWVVRLR